MPLCRNEFYVIEKRYHYAVLFSALENEKIYYSDEAGFQVPMGGKYGKSKKGEKAASIVLATLANNIFVSAAICEKRLFLFEAMDCPYNASYFSEFIDHFLDFIKKEGRIIIMDNVPFRKAEGIRRKN